MADTIKVGSMNVPKPAAIAALAAAGAIVAYAYWSRSGGGSGKDETPGIDPSIDPDTGLPYGDQFGAGLGSSGGGQNFVPSASVPQDYAPTSNAAWTQQVLLYFEDTYNKDALSAAIGKVFSGQAITDTELNMFNAAKAVMGNPPQSYPPIHMVSAAPPGTTNPGASLPAPANLRALHTYRTQIQMTWNTVKGAKGYAVYGAEDPVGGSTPVGQRFTSVLGNTYQYRGLKPGKRYRFDVHAVGSDNKLGARARTYVYTKK